MDTRLLRLLGASVLALGLVAAACGDDDDDDDGNGDPAATNTTSAEPTDEPSDNGGDSAEVSISAENLAFSTGRIEMQAGVETTITFTNNDDSIPHNIHITGGDVDASFPAFTGADGPTETLTVTIDEPGTYQFQCDIHPGTMTGTVEVSE